MELCHLEKAVKNMKRRTIRFKFLCTIATIVGLFSCVIVYYTWSTGNAQMVSLLEDKSNLALQFDLAIRSYVSETIRPFAQEHTDKDSFIPETMSTSFVARTIFDKVRKEHPEYTLKFSSDDPRNPLNQAGPEELKIIKYFNDNPEAQKWVGKINLNGKEHIGMFSARRMKKDCLQCHGIPKDAPASLIARYGDKAGFHRPLGEVIALDSIAMPLEKYQAVAMKQAIKTSVIMIAALTFLLITLYYIFQRMIGQRLAALAEHFRNAVNQENHAVIKNLDFESNDEIGDLVKSFNKMAEDLKNTTTSLTELQSIKKNLQESEERFDLAMSVANDGIWDWNVADSTVLFDDRYYTLAGYEPSEFPSSFGEWEKRVHPDDIERAKKIIEQYLRGETPNYRVEFRFLRKDGDYMWILSKGKLVAWDQEGNPTRFIGTQSDITERRRIESNLNDAMQQAEAANQAKSQFLANMSHEIRTPMNGILGFSDLLADEELTEEQKGYVDIILDSGQNLLNLIDDILDLSKIEAGQLRTETTDCVLAELLNSIGSLMRPKVIEKGLEFEIIKTNELPANICSDPTRLRQCLINLIGNAIKFTEKGYVHVNISLDFINDIPYISFKVEDTGIGIPKEKHSKVFESFTQADGDTTRKYGGTGLGLTITKQLAEHMDGQLTMTSQEGVGTTFTLMIPAGVDITKQQLLDSHNLSNV